MTPLRSSGPSPPPHPPPRPKKPVPSPIGKRNNNLWILPGLVSRSLMMITTGSSRIASGSGSWGWTKVRPLSVSITKVYDSSPGPNDCNENSVFNDFTQDLFIIQQSHKEATSYHCVLKKFTQRNVDTNNTNQWLTRHGKRKQLTKSFTLNINVNIFICDRFFN